MFKVTIASLLVFTCLLAAGCQTTVHKTLTATGGSRADGTIELSFEHGVLEKPQIDLNAALETARQRCKAWGYPNAEAFGGERRQCQLANNYGCSRWYVTHTYQCLGKPRG